MSLDVLERNIINDAIARDVKDNLNRAPSERKNHHVQNVVDAINACGVSFCVWQKKDANGKLSGIYEWTSLVGNEKKKVLPIFQHNFQIFLKNMFLEQFLKYGRFSNSLLFKLHQEP